MAKHLKKVRKTESHQLFKNALCVIQNIFFIGFSAFCGNYILTLGQFNSYNSVTIKYFIEEHFNSYLLGLALCLLFVLLLDVLIGDSIIGGGLFIIISFILQFININKMMARQAPFYPEELKMITEMKTLSTMVSGNELKKLILTLLLVLGLTILLFVLKKKSHIFFSFRTNIIVRFIAFILLLIPLSQVPKMGTKGHYLDKFLTEHNVDLPFWGWNQPGNYNTNGFVVGFVFNAIPQPVMNKPEGYSKEAIQDIQKKYEVNADGQSVMNGKSNLIFILSESFIDPDDISEHIKFPQDPIPYIHGLMKDSGGKVLVSEYGGGTANMEFELLTGLSTALFTGIPYQDVVPKHEDFPSFVKVLKNNGYDTLAVHPYDGNMYKRSTVYPNLGIDKFLDRNNVTFVNKIDNSRFISDESAYSEVIGLLRNSKEPLFINLITMQNHQPYSEDVYKNPYSFQSDVNLTQDEKTKIGNYIKGISCTDEFTHQFIEQLQSLSTDTLVFFFGDHYPGQNVFKKFSGNNINDYLTPYFFYSTKSKVPSVKDITGLYYIQLQIAKQLGIEITPFMNLLSQVEVEWSAISRKYALDTFGSTMPSEKISGEALKDYRMITYDIVSGKRYSLNRNFFGY